MNVKIKVKPDGTTRVFAGEAEIVGVQSMCVFFSPHGVPKATMDILIQEADIIAKAGVLATVMPDGKRYQLMEIKDAGKA